MVPQVVVNLGWAITFIFIGTLTGIAMMMATLRILPNITNKLTPNFDEEKEILRGNRAVAEYFGRVISAEIIGISIIFAAAILGGVIAGLHG